jgi:hypothetical protein
VDLVQREIPAPPVAFKHLLPFLARHQRERAVTNSALTSTIIQENLVVVIGSVYDGEDGQ